LPLTLFPKLPLIHRPRVGALEEIVVTANRRSANLQTVPTSVTAIGATQLKDFSITTTTQITQFVAGLQLVSPNAGTDNFYSIRGATQNDYAEHEESPVATYMDGVYLSQSAGTAALLFDTDRVSKSFVGRRARCSAGMRPPVSSNISPSNRRRTSMDMPR